MEVVKGVNRRRRIEELNVNEVIEILKSIGLSEFESVVRDKGLDGAKLTGRSDELLKVERTKPNTKKLMKFVDDLNDNPDKYIKFINARSGMEKTVFKVKHNETVTVEKNGTRVSVTKVREENFSASVSSAEDILHKLVAPKSFLYRNQNTKKVKTNTAYVPMNVGTSTRKRLSRFFRLSSYEYPIFDLSRFKYFSTTNRSEIFNDRGYYSIKKNQSNQEDLYAAPAPRIRHRSQCSAEEFLGFNDRLCVEEHFYEDLCYNDMYTSEMKRNRSSSGSNLNTLRRSYMVRIQEIFQSFRMPSLFKQNERDSARDTKVVENNDSSEMYDSVNLSTDLDEKSNVALDKASKSKVEDYLEPIQTSRLYCDVVYKEKDESLVGMIMKMFENKFGTRKESNDANQSDSDDGEVPKVLEPIQTWNDGDKKTGERTNMAARPLPVPVENEGYYMDIDRNEAVRLLEGQEDGTFLLRPSSQANHAYTMSVSCDGSVHNVGVRRRDDGRLALGYSRRGERSFATVSSLLRYHRKKKLMLVVGGTSLGSTTLKESPLYYQVPSNIPVAVRNI